MTLRAATPKDVPALLSLEARSFGDDAWGDASVRGELEGTGRHAVVAVEGEDVVGYAVTMRVGDLVDLQRIVVHPDHRRKGLARSLLDEVLRHARREGATRVLLEVAAGNDAALAFYADAGFVEIDRRRRYYRDGSDAVVMECSWGHAAGAGRG